jgi:hypothetical protein
VKAEIPTPEEKLAGYLSADFANAGDEFAQHAMLIKLRPVIQKRIDAAKGAPLMVVRIGFDLPKYDFERHGFPSGLMGSTFVTFNNQYILEFSNWDQLDLVPFDEAKASILDTTLRRGRQATLRVYGTLDACKEEQVNGYPEKVIYLKASRMVLAVGAANKFAGEKVIDQ